MPNKPKSERERERERERGIHRVCQLSWVWKRQGSMDEEWLKQRRIGSMTFGGSNRIKDLRDCFER